MADLFDEKNISPMLLNEVKGPFVGDDYIYELKAILSKAVTEGYNLSVTRWIEKNRKRRYAPTRMERLER